MSPDNTVTNREAKSHSGFFFRGEERIENMQTHVFVHTHSCVVYRDLDNITSLFCCKCENAATGHGIDGVEDHVDEDFAQLRLIAHDWRIAVKLQVEADMHIGLLSPIFPTWPRNLSNV